MISALLCNIENVPISPATLSFIGKNQIYKSDIDHRLDLNWFKPIEERRIGPRERWLQKTLGKMKIFYALVLLLYPKYVYSLDKIKLVTFDGSDGTTFSFHELNDPVMVRADGDFFLKVCNKLS